MILILRPDNNNLQKAMNFLSQIDSSKVYTVTIEQKEPSKTRQQEKYFHMLLQIISEFNGDDVTDLKRDITWRCGIREIFEDPETGEIIEYPKYTSGLKISEYAKLIEAAQIVCMSLDLSYPDPRDLGLKIF